MLMQILFILYSILLIVSCVISGLNYYRLLDYTKIHPQIITYLLPFTINFILAKTIFMSVNPILTTLIPCFLIYFLGRKLKTIRIIGLTGGIATGKSTLVHMMKQNLNNIEIIDCDLIAKQLTKKNQYGYKIILKLLNENYEEYLDPKSKEIIRDKFSELIFRNFQLRKIFTKKIGRFIFWKICNKIVNNIFKKHNIMLIDAPILYESKYLKWMCYPIIVVGCDQNEQIRRLKQRNKYSEEQALSRIRSQMPLKLKKQKADIYIQNQCNKEQLLTLALTKLNKYLKLKK